MSIKNLYHNKWCPRFFFKKYDGGKLSGVVGYMLIEWKPVMSIGLLRFKAGSRDAYHSHAFNAATWWLSGKAYEMVYPAKTTKKYEPSFRPKITKRDCCHKVVSERISWAFTVRGPWKDTWREVRDGKEITLTHGRKLV